MARAPGCHSVLPNLDKAFKSKMVFCVGELFMLVKYNVMPIYVGALILA